MFWRRIIFNLLAAVHWSVINGLSSVYYTAYSLSTYNSACARIPTHKHTKEKKKEKKIDECVCVCRVVRECSECWLWSHATYCLQWCLQFLLGRAQRARCRRTFSVFNIILKTDNKVFRTDLNSKNTHADSLFTANSWPCGRRNGFVCGINCCVWQQEQPCLSAAWRLSLALWEFCW